MLSKENPVYYVMTKELVVASLSSRFSQVQELFMEHKIRHLPVMDGDKLVGIISNHDIMKAYAKTLAGAGTISRDQLDDVFKIYDWMTKNPITMASYEPIAKAAKILTDNTFAAIPIVDDEELVGVVTNKDLVSYLSQIYEQEGPFD